VAFGIKVFDHEADVPFVVKSSPEFPVCDGRLIGAGSQATPLTAEESAVKIFPFDPTANDVIASLAVPTIMSPLEPITALTFRKYQAQWVTKAQPLPCSITC
jgi:hypothetical protein